MSSSSSVVTAAHLNNRGVHSFFLHHSSDLSSSLRYFRQALECVAASIHHHDDEECEYVADDTGVLEEPDELVPRIVVAGSVNDAPSSAGGPLPTTTSTTMTSTPATSKQGSEPTGDEARDNDVLYREVVEARSVSSVPGDDGAGAALAAGPVEVELIEQDTLTYARPINLIPSEGAYDVDPLMNASRMSSIVLFNLAIVFHAMAHSHPQRGDDDEDGDSGSTTKVIVEDPAIRHVVQAQALYRKSLRLLRHEEFDDGDDDDRMEEEAEDDRRGGGPERLVHQHHPVLDVLHMALHNNLAATSYALGDYDECQAHLDDLVTACLHVQRQRTATTTATTDDNNHDNFDPDTRTVLEWHANVFLCNAHFLRHPPHGAAAA